MWLKRFPPTPPTHSKYEPGACKGTAKHCRWASPNKRIPSVTLLFTSETLFYDRGGKKKQTTPHHERSSGNPIQMRFRARSFPFFFSFFFPASCDLLFSKTHSVLISPCTSGTFCLLQLSCLCQSRPQPCYSPEKHNKLSERQTRESRRGDRLNISPLSCVFFPLCLHPYLSASR